MKIYTVTLQCMYGKVVTEWTCKSPIIAIGKAYTDFKANYEFTGNWTLATFDTITVTSRRIKS